MLHPRARGFAPITGASANPLIYLANRASWWRLLHNAGYFRVCYLTGGRRVAWIVRLVQIGADGDEPFADVMTINRPDGLDDIANLGLTVADGKQLLAGLQQEIVAA